MALSTVQSTFLGSATTSERNSQLVNRNLSPGTVFFNLTTSTMQITQLGGNSPLWQDLSTESFVSLAIGNITPASIGAPQTDGTGATGTWGVDISGNSSTSNLAALASTVTTNADLTGDVTSSGNATTLETVNPNVGTFGGASNVGSFAVNAKGLITGASDVAITPAAIGAPQTDGTGATGTWGVDISGNSSTSDLAALASTVTTNADLTGPVESNGNVTSIPNGNITADMLDAAAKPTFQNCYDADSNFNLDINPFTIKAVVVTTPSQNSYSGTSATAGFLSDTIRGFKFTALPGAGETMRVTHLQYVDANFNISFGSTREVGIYDVATENLLGQATVSKADPLVGGFRTSALVSPVDLISGQEYTVVTVVPVGESAYAGVTLVPSPEVTLAVLASGPTSSVLVFPQNFGVASNQISAGGFEYELLSNDDVFSVDSETVESKKTFTVKDEPQIGKASGLVITGRSDSVTTIGTMNAIKISSATEMSFTQAEDKEAICGITTTSAAAGELFKYVESGIAQGLMADGQSVTFGEFLRVSSAGKLRQDGGADAIAQAMQTVAAETPGLPVMMHLLHKS